LVLFISPSPSWEFLLDEEALAESYVHVPHRIVAFSFARLFYDVAKGKDIPSAKRGLALFFLLQCYHREPLLFPFLGFGQ